MSQPKSILMRASLVLLAVLLATGGIFRLAVNTGGQQVSNTWTVNADFDQGGLQGVEHDTVADQLQLSETSSTFPFMWVANAGEDTVSKIDTNTGRELARYRTWFYVGVHGAWSGPAPSRTAVDSDGNVYVLNRHFDGRQPLVMKILSTGGIDRNGNGQIDTSVDANGDGRISSSEMMPLVDSPANGRIDDSEIQDERVVWAKPVGGAGRIGRSLSMGTDGNVWVGTFNDGRYYKVSSATGAVLAGPYYVPVNPYGSAVDQNGILWSASLSNWLGKLDTSTGASSRYSHAGQNYGIAVGNGKVYLANLGGYTYAEFDPVTNTFSYPAYNKGTRFQAIGISVDQNGDIFASRYQGGMYKFKKDGTLIWYSPPQPGTGEARGAIVDSNGDVWVNHLNNNNISKYRGTDGAALGVFPVGAAPYTYSDATGIAAMSQTTPTGYWTVVFDGGSAGTDWGTVNWNGSTPAGTGLEVKVRAADTAAGLEAQNYEGVSDGVQFSATGRFIQIQVKLTANQAGTSPVLYDLAVESLLLNQPPAADAGGPYTVPEGGSVALNGSGSDPDGDPLTYSWDLDNDGVFETAGQDPTFSAAGMDGPSSRTVVLQVHDDDGASATSSATVTIENVAPVITDLAGNPLAVLGSPTTVVGSFTDDGIPDTHTVSIDWGDSTTSAGAVSEVGGSGTWVAAHTYTTPWFYTITVTLVDDDGGAAVQSLDVAVTATGMMTGGGRVDTGALAPPKGKGSKPQAIHTTHGFTLFVNPDLTLGGVLQYNDHRSGDIFHVTSLTSVILVDDPLLDPENPAAQFDTAIVTGVGRLNGVDGVQFEAVITDNGEPGRTDTFSITFPDGQSAGISGTLAVGNSQAHPLS